MKNIAFFFLLFPLFVFSQDDLLDELNEEIIEDKKVISVFKSLKVVNFETTKLVNKKDFYLVISHRFGSVKNGIDDLFGLDQAVTQFKFIYGINEWLNLGLARSSYKKKYGLHAKFRLKYQEKNNFVYDIKSKTKTGKNERYRYYITPLEIIAVIMSGEGDYVRKYEDEVYNNIKIKTYKQEVVTFLSDKQNFKVNIPSYHTIFGNKKDNKALENTEIYAFDEQENALPPSLGGQSYEIMNTLYPPESEVSVQVNSGSNILQELNDGINKITVFDNLKTGYIRNLQNNVNFINIRY